MLDPLSVRVEVPAPPDTEVGLNDADMPAGSPVADRLTVPVNPLTAVTVTVAVAEPADALP